MKILIFKDDNQSTITLCVDKDNEAVHFRINGEERSTISKSFVIINDKTRSDAFSNLVELGYSINFSSTLVDQWFHILSRHYNCIVSDILQDIGKPELITLLQENIGPEEEYVYNIIINIAIEWEHTISEMLDIKYYGNNLYRWDGNEYLILDVHEAEERVRDILDEEYEDIAEEVPSELYDYIDKCGWIDDRINNIDYEDYLSSTGEEHTLSDDYYAYPQ